MHSNKKKTNKEFLKQISQIYGDCLEISSPYVNAHTKVDCFCTVHKYRFQSTPNSLLRPSGCKYCGKENMAKKQRHTLKEVQNLLPYNIIIVGKYKGMHNKTKFICTNCHKLLIGTPSQYIRTQSCGNHNKHRTNSSVDKELNTLTDGKYLRVSEYLGMNKPILLYHKKCGKVFKTDLHNFIDGNKRCKCVSSSHGEMYIEKYLNNHSYKYVLQKRFDDLYDKMSLPFDFVVYTENKTYTIEYQGEQHTDTSLRYDLVHNENNFEIALDKFAIRNLHDDMKRDYCNNKGIIEIEIPFTENTQKKVNCYLNKYLVN